MITQSILLWPKPSDRYTIGRFFRTITKTYPEDEKVPPARRKYGIIMSGFIVCFLWRGIYLSKLPTLSRKIELAINWACRIPFPPNIIQIRLPYNQSTDAGSDKVETHL